MSGCLWSFIPFPILIALYYIIRTPLRFLMNIPTDVIGQISDLATSLGYEAATSGQASAYEQIYLAKFVHEHWADFAGKFDHLIDLDYSFLGLDLASTPSSLLSSFPHGGWPMWGVLLLPVISTGIQGAHDARHHELQRQRRQRPDEGHDAHDAAHDAVDGLYPARRSVRVLIANSGFSLLQELTLNKYFNKILDREETEKEREKRERRYEKMKAAQQNYDRQRAEMSGGKKTQNKGGQKNQKKKSGQKQAGTNENGRVGPRPYARGRSYSEDHYNN